MTKVINFFGAACSRKSTMAASIFHQLKAENYKCEAAWEVAKDYVYDNNPAILCQPNVFGNQLWRIERLIDKVDYIICDSPLPLAVIYNKNYPESFNHAVMDIFQKFDNVNLMMLKDKNHHEDGGRIHGLEESLKLENKLINLLRNFKIPHQTVPFHYTTLEVGNIIQRHL